MSPSERRIASLRRRVLDHYRRRGRDLPWRNTRDPYAILVSEVMLQQTQVARVERKYPAFLARFPGFQSLAAATAGEVLAAWQGLGYNRRALALREAARVVIARWGGKLPEEPGLLRELPGVGPATAAAVAAFAFGRPAAFIETNIRTVFLHHFFPRGTGVRDAEIMPLVEASLDRRDPRRWFYALMDYGVMLKAAAGNAGRRSAHHVRQPPFRGSDRQIRGGIVRELLAVSPQTAEELARRLAQDPSRVRAAAEILRREGFLRRRGGKYAIAG